MEGYQLGGGEREGGESIRNKKHKCRYKIDREVKNSMGNGEAKELICMTHGHELKRGMMV